MSDRRPRILIPDTTPLSLLAMLGKEALSWLFVPGAEVWVTGMVRHEALRDPEPGDDQRKGHRQALQAWFAENAHRIRIAASGNEPSLPRPGPVYVRAR